MRFLTARLLFRNLAIIPLFIGGWLSAQAPDITVFVPSHSSNYSDISSDPFSLIGPTNSIRWQQVVSASDFSTVNSDGCYIWGMGAVQFGSFPVDYPEFQINVSTTSRAPDALSPVFSENTGGDDLTVFHGRVEGMFWGSILVLFDSPFYYNPSQGNLLLDFRNFSGMAWDESTRRPRMDAAYSFSDTVSSVFRTNVYSPQGNIATFGLCMGMFLQTITKPTLRIESSNDLAMIRWPTNKANFILETSTNLTASNAWNIITNKPVAVNGENLTTDQIGESMKFYRLRLDWNSN